MQRLIDYLLIITIAFSGVFCLYQSASAGSSDDSYLAYYNSRFAYSISYPANILMPQGESDNSDGQKFLSKDGRTMMVVYGKYEAKELGQTLKTLYIEESRGGTKDHAKRVVTYRTVKSDWFVVSGYV